MQNSRRRALPFSNELSRHRQAAAALRVSTAGMPQSRHLGHGPPSCVNWESLTPPSGSTPASTPQAPAFERRSLFTSAQSFRIADELPAHSRPFARRLSGNSRRPENLSAQHLDFMQPRVINGAVDRLRHDRPFAPDNSVPEQRIGAKHVVNGHSPPKQTTIRACLLPDRRYVSVGNNISAPIGLYRQQPARDTPVRRRKAQLPTFLRFLMGSGAQTGPRSFKSIDTVPLSVSGDIPAPCGARCTVKVGPTFRRTDPHGWEHRSAGRGRKQGRTRTGRIAHAPTRRVWPSVPRRLVRAAQGMMARAEALRTRPAIPHGLVA